MTHRLPKSQRPHLAQYDLNKSCADFADGSGIAGTVPVSKPSTARISLMTPRHHRVPFFSRLALKNANSKTNPPCASGKNICQPLHEEGVSPTERNTANATKPEGHAVPILPKDAWGLLFLVKNPSHDCRSEMK